MSAILLISFLLACALGAVSAWRTRLSDAPARAGVILILSTAIIAGVVTVAAEAGSPTARYLGLFAVLLASAALCGAFAAVRRADRTKPVPPQK